MPGDRRVLAIDPGDVRIGMALSDPTGIASRPLPALERRGSRRDPTAIAALVETHDVGTVVVGLPLQLDGSDGERAAAARELAAAIEARVPRDVRVELWDERLSTVEVERTMIDAGVRRGKRRRTVDGVAAALILRGWLDARP